MKKILLSIFSLAIIAGVNAQSGTVLVGGNVDFNASNVKDSAGNTQKVNTFEFSPTVGYQFNDNWTAGVVASVSTSKNMNPLTDEYVKDITTTGFGVGPFVRYTQPISDIFAVFGQLQGQYRTFNAKNDGKDIDALKANGFNVGFFPAVFINVKNGFGLNFNIGGIEYNSLKLKESETKTNSFNVNFGKTASIGISKNF